MFWNYSCSLKVFLLTFVTLSAFAVVAEGYLGPRYGKRLPSNSGGEVGRIVGRSSGPRTIQSRSQARFYAGSRYGGKRSYWPSSINSPEGQMTSADLSQSSIDCVYVPYLGVRCALPPRSEEWGHGGGLMDGESNSDSDDGPRDLYAGPEPAAPSFTRTSIIDGTSTSGSK